MKLLIQRVNSARVTVDNNCISEIGKGLLLFLGIAAGDSEALIAPLVEKMQNLRIFSDSEDKLNLSLIDVGGEVLVVSQFTLYADCRKGRRPSFTDAAPPDHARSLYEKFIERCMGVGLKVKSGQFQADMKVDLQNDGPLTIILDTENL